MWYSKYRGRTIGRILHAINSYCGLQYADTVTINPKENTVSYWGEPFATYTWDGNTDIPIFVFDKKWNCFEIEQERKKSYLDDAENV